MSMPVTQCVMKRGGSRRTWRSCRRCCVGKTNELAVEGGGPKIRQGFPRAKDAKISLLHQDRTRKSQGKRASQIASFHQGAAGGCETQTELLACLHENQGHIVPYKQLVRLLGHRSTRLEQMHILRQYAAWITKTLTAHKALCMLAVAPRVGYVLCGHE